MGVNCFLNNKLNVDFYCCSVHLGRLSPHVANATTAPPCKNEPNETSLKPRNFFNDLPSEGWDPGTWRYRIFKPPVTVALRDHLISWGPWRTQQDPWWQWNVISLWVPTTAVTVTGIIHHQYAFHRLNWDVCVCVCTYLCVINRNNFHSSLFFVLHFSSPWEP